jgi:serine/threonine protein phosphatase PrpC
MNLDIQYFGATDVGLVRTNNEDNFLISETLNGKLFLVCDGMGGHESGEVAAQLAIDAIQAFLNEKKYDNIYVALNDAIRNANEIIFNAAQVGAGGKNMGTTCVTLLIHNDEIFIGHVGDSRAYIYHKLGLHRLTKDHSLVQQLVDGGIIKEEDAENHPRKNELTKALGTNSIVEPEIISQSIKPAKGDVFLLCSDGLSGLINDKEISTLLRDKKAESEFIINGLISSAKNAGGHDNITAIVIKILESPFTEARFQSHNTSIKVAHNSGLFMKNKKVLLILLSIIFLCLFLWLFIPPKIKEDLPDNKAIPIEKSNPSEKAIPTIDSVLSSKKSVPIDTAFQDEKVNTKKDSLPKK